MSSDTFKQDAPDVIYRLRQLMRILRILLRQSRSLAPSTMYNVLNDESADRFARHWYAGFKQIILDSGESKVTVSPAILLMCDIACLALRWMDIWKDHQLELRETVRLLLQYLRDQVSQLLLCAVT